MNDTEAFSVWVNVAVSFNKIKRFIDVTKNDESHVMKRLTDKWFMTEAKDKSYNIYDI